jgi:DNA-directed RNA polymerase specialized sigma subunit
VRRYQRLLDGRASRFYLPGGDQDDVAQEARIGFVKAIRFYRGGRGSSFRTFAELCVSRQLGARSPRRGGPSTGRSTRRHEATRPSAR